MKSRGKKNACILWKGTVGIEQALTLRKEILSVFESYNSVTVNLSGVEDIDIAGMQILLAAIKESEVKHIPFTITGPVPEHIQDILKSVSIQLPIEEAENV